MRMSTIGASTRNSVRTHATASTALATKRPTTRIELQPQPGPSVSPSNNVTSTPESSVAPIRSSLDGVFTGDSGTYRQTPIVAMPTTTAPTMNSQRHDAYSTSAPESTRPRPPPTPRIADTIPTPEPTFSGG